MLTALDVPWGLSALSVLSLTTSIQADPTSAQNFYLAEILLSTWAGGSHPSKLPPSTTCARGGPISGTPVSVHMFYNQAINEPSCQCNYLSCATSQNTQLFLTSTSVQTYVHMSIRFGRLQLNFYYQYIQSSLDQANTSIPIVTPCQEPPRHQGLWECLTCCTLKHSLFLEVYS